MTTIIDNYIDRFANYLQERNNLDRIAYLKVRLGLQVVVSNIIKLVGTYGISFLCGLFFYTLATHLSYFVIRYNAHGAHAKTPVQCHVLNLLLFVLFPWLIVYTQISQVIMFIVAVFSFIILCIYAPSATKKQPIPQHMIKGFKIKTIVVSLIVIAISFLFPGPYPQLIYAGVFLVAITQLPIFSTKEDV
ncbi:accessory gene regulator AgrB [Staphylococcus auricularis]|uniref:accessory gene regulator AgrB n=1 Tax=Staphylococcus auricularis TaxID=29379 RepID=UPI00242E0B0B|nr:accessory gene regulator AgrB [Staphylococcus auricularis]